MWKIVSVEAREPIHLGGGQYHPNTATCEKCSQEIRWVATVRNEAGEVLKTGLDCAATLSGGPELRELRRAQRRHLWSKRSQEQRQERQLQADANAVAYAELLRDLDLVAGSDSCRDRDRDLARGIARSLRSGARGFDLVEWERAAVNSALRTARMPPSRHIGTPGDKLARVPVTFEGRFSWIGSFGWRSVYRFRCDDGAVLAWYTQTGLVNEIPGGSVDQAVGARFLLSAAIKKHGQYDGVAQTEILRVKLMPQGSGHFYTVDPGATGNDRFGVVEWAASLADIEAKYPEFEAVGPFGSYEAAQRAVWAECENG